MDTEKDGLVPKLRFPEFRDARAWNKYTLIQVATFRRGSFPQPYGLPEWYDDTGGMPFVQVFDVNDDLRLKPTTKRKISKLAAEQSVFIPKGSLIVTIQGSIGRVAVTQYDAYVDRTLLLFRKFHLPTEKIFFAYIVQNLFEIERKKAPGGIIKTITKEVLSSFEIKLPKLSEQQKIANCLSSIDDLITAQTQKIDTLKAHKKGLMQQLFPAQGETTPKLRFPEFRGAGDWKQELLKNVFSIFQGYAFSSKDNIDAGVRWLKIADVSIQQMNHDAPSYLPIEYQEKYGKFSVKQGDYVIALTRPILSKQLKMAPVDELFHGALLNQRVGKLVTAQNITFVYYLLQTSKLISDIEKSISGSEPPNLSTKQIEGIKTYVPFEKEQQKIADCLFSIDNLITAQSQKLATLKAHKKGLMQQLFPAIDKVNG